MASMKIACAVFVIFMVVAPIAKARISCDSIYYPLTDCIGYLFGDTDISTRCCDVVKAIAAAATTTGDRQATCRCLEIFADQFQYSINKRNGANIFNVCGVVNSPYKISINSECYKIHAKEVVADARIANILTTM
ncbi:hypothetical protein KIW84_076329 [Lathyrus oleraceus]|uniref:Non-specific lipid-transfer protein n=1 Tax=Pisum sativum TaxID=3888 RepID=A0A9D4VW96_PEA|nr:hypothetical protein KIW84_076329 [Pisum sativum]